jgi:hypothetical protein
MKFKTKSSSKKRKNMKITISQRRKVTMKMNPILSKVNLLTLEMKRRRLKVVPKEATSHLKSLSRVKKDSKRRIKVAC